MAKCLTSLDGVFHALADPTRRAVVCRLGKGPTTVSELAAPFDMALPSFMKHLQILENSKIIHSRKIGRTRTCEIRTKELAKAESWIAEQCKIWEDRTDRLENYVAELQAKEQDK